MQVFSGYPVVNAEVDPMEGGGLSDTGAAAIQKAQADLRYIAMCFLLLLFSFY